MAFRNLTGDGDWCFGSGISDYVEYSKEVGLNAKTRVLSFLNNCFFDLDAGIDYWNLLGYNNQQKLENAIQNVIVQTPGVMKVETIDLYLNAQRNYTLQYSIIDVFSNEINDEFNLIEVV